MHQNGTVQATGGAKKNPKAFYDIYNARGLTGRQGVLIPKTKIMNLMLRQDIVQACSAGTLPAGSIGQRVEHSLRRSTQSRQRFHYLTLGDEA